MCCIYSLICYTLIIENLWNTASEFSTGLLLIKPSKTMNILGYTFEGPYDLNTNFNQIGAVYFISDSKNSTIDVGQTNNLRDRIANHERKNCWLRNTNNVVYIYALVQKNEDLRLSIESKIRNAYNFSCGDF